MTEAMSRHEIEDVLSSIRRLVSHDDRAPVADPKPASGMTGKLVLTSALRVDDADAPDDVPATTSPGDSSMSELSDAPTDSSAAENSAAQPAFSAAPGRTSLVARIAQAGQQTPADGAASIALELPAQSPEAAPEGPLTQAVTESALEATLARLEQALSIEAGEAEQPAIDAGDKNAALAKLVAEIVRTELQGELGERITRNIRKLVRAEVARELQMRNL